MTMRSFAHRGKVVHLGGPGTIAAGDPGFVSMRNYQGSFLFIAVGTLTGGTNVSLRQAQNVAGSGIKDLVITEYYTNLVTASPEEDADKWRKVASTTAVFALANNTQFLIPVRPGSLDVDNDFDCVGITADAAAENSFAALFLHDGPEGITDNLIHIPSAKVNRMP